MHLGTRSFDGVETIEDNYRLDTKATSPAEQGPR